MCIRDRARAVQIRTPEVLVHVLHGGLQIEADCSIGRPWADCGLHFGPVSYTHLRAHETSAHL
eukprot:12266041-Alexandrium_andersonii.AAC.1